VERFPDWRSDPHALLRRLIARAEELNGEALTDDVALLLGREARFLEPYRAGVVKLPANGHA
jgi:hypothetical protein